MRILKDDKVEGEYYFGDAAWTYVQRRTGVKFLAIIRKLATENARRNQKRSS